MAVLEWRERTAPPSIAERQRCRARENHAMKNRLTAHLFGYAMTVAALAAFVVPNWGKIW